MDFFTRLDAVRERWNVLEHPFYTGWSQGALSREDIGFYAGEYRHAVVALADAMGAAARAAEPAIRAELEQHAAEEAAHIELWDAFGKAVGAENGHEPRPETRACAAAWTAGETVLEHLVATYAVEAAQPAIAKTKLEGLIRHYGMDERPATEYFALHAELDVTHAEHSRELIEDRLEGADADRLLEVAETALRGNWELLDGVVRARPMG
ncbi:MAG: iron-containing redox enzyme family protein [Actinomycetota bacterium]|nr:iron-containing redox enzyme family protein [Actinomycetota bacterium]